MSTLKVEAAEAVASALYQMPWSEFLGEADIAAQPDVEKGHAMWFHLGEKPLDMRVTIFRPDDRDVIEVRAEWHNRHAEATLKGEKVFSITTYGATNGSVFAASEKAVLGVLEIYKDVLSGEGVAGSIESLAPAPEGTTDDE